MALTNLEPGSTLMDHQLAWLLTAAFAIAFVFRKMHVVRKKRAEKTPMTNDEIHKDRPDGWGSDPLSEYLDMAWNNAFATYSLIPEFYQLISAIDQSYLDFLETLNDPEHLASPLFIFRAHSAYRSAASLVVSGRVPESYSLSRACMENAIYGFFFSKEPAAFDLWRQRHDDDESRKKIRRELTMGRFIEMLKQEDAATGEVFRIVYERTIDYGAHPNPQGIFSSLEIEESETEVAFDTNYLMGDTTALRLALKTVATAGIVTLDVSGLVFPDRLTSCGVKERLDDLRRGL